MTSTPAAAGPRSSAPAQRLEATSGQLAAILSAELVGPADIPLTGLRGLEQAAPTDLSFIRSPRFAHQWAKSRAGAAIVTRGIEVAGHDPRARALLIVADADLAMVQLLEAFAPRPIRPPAGIHPSSVVDPSARIDPTACIGPLCCIGPGAVIAADAVLHSRITIGAAAHIGQRTELFPGVSVLDRCIVGNDCILHANVSIGADGFGYRPDPSGRGLLKIPHAGIVHIGDHVEIGAGSCIDRAKFDATTIGAGTKIDNLVQIAHNVRIGRGCVICGVTGIAGSVTMGNGVTIGGCCGIADGVRIGDGATLGAKSGLISDLPAGQTWLGFPAREAREQLRNWAAARSLPDLLRRIKKILPIAGPDGDQKSR